MQTSKKTTILLLGWIGIALACASSAGAATAPATTTAPKPVVNNGTIAVELSKGTPVPLPAAATSVAIANPAIADVEVISPTLLMVVGRGVGETTLLAVDAQDKVLTQANINVSHNLGSLRKAIKDMSVGNKISAVSQGNTIVLKGKVDSPVASEAVQRLASGYLANPDQRVINLLDTSSSDQVMLKVRVVELNRSELKRFGINWENLIASGSFLFGIGQGRDIVSGLAAFDRATNTDNSIFAGYRNGQNSINAAIDALESDGLVSVLAEPNLTTRSGQQASFLAGGEIPIPVEAQNNQVTIQYRQFGVSLQFTPVVLSRNKISLSVLPEVSALSTAGAVRTTSGISVPSFTTRRASTTVDLGSGQTFAIAGLLRNDVSNNIDKFPFLGDVPVLGTLFRSSNFRNDQTELVILVTPYIVKPIDDPSKLATPLDGHAPASEYDRIALGKLSKETAPQPDSAQPVPTALNGIGGEAGFVMR